MSWDATLTVDGEVVCEVNYTHNCNDMIRAAGFDGWWRSADDMTGAEMRTAIGGVLEAFNRNPDDFRRMDPENGWGSFDTLKPVLREMHIHSRRNPRGSWEVTG